MLNVTAKTYRYLDESEAAPEPDATKGAARKGGKATVKSGEAAKKGKTQRPPAKKSG